MKIRNTHRSQATLIVDGVGEVPFNTEIEVPDELGKALIQSKHWHLVQSEQPAPKKRASQE